MLVSPDVVGAKLRKLRGKRTQREVADAVNISISALSLYESGQRVPRDDVKCALANYYGRSVAHIFYTQ